MRFLQSSLIPHVKSIKRTQHLIGTGIVRLGILALLLFYFQPAILGENLVATQLPVNAAIAARTGSKTKPAKPRPAASGSPNGTTYYLAPAQEGGNDSNSGLSPGAPWLSPNHSVNCGDVIVALASASYNAANFGTGKWGWVSCPSSNNVAWLQCEQFDACKISSNNSAGIWVDHSYWGVQGWEVTTTYGARYGACFVAAPSYNDPIEIHHIIFANNIANGCQAGGFASSSRGQYAGVDYLAIVGNIAYDAAQGSTNCYSGISIDQPIQSDYAAGTHIYVAGNFSYGNSVPDPCAGGSPTDGNGLIFDTFDGIRSGLTPYRAQAVAENNLLLNNGGMGIAVGHNNTGQPPFATIYIRHNTLWGNNADRDENWNGCGELTLARTTQTTVSYNLAATDTPTGCGYNPIYAIAISLSDGSVQASNNFVYSASGYNLVNWENGSFSYSPNNTIGVSPNFSNPVRPGPPYCGGSSNATNCMWAVTADFTPTSNAALGFGYQGPRETSSYDPLFPQWLCYANLPPGLIKMGC